MTELNVVLDLQASPDSPEWIVTRQRVRAAGGSLELVGEPVQTRLSFAARRVKVWLSLSVKHASHPMVIAHVQNVGFTPLELSKVEFTRLFVPAQNGDGDGVHGDGSRPLGFILAERATSQFLDVNETRTYYLPPRESIDVLAAVAKLPTDAYAVIAYAAAAEVGRAAGAAIKPALTDQVSFDSVLIVPIVEELLGTFTVDECDRVKTVAQRLASVPAHQWASQRDVLATDEAKDLAVLVVPENLRVLVRPVGVGHIEIKDIVRMPVSNLQPALAG